VSYIENTHNRVMVPPGAVVLVRPANASATITIGRVSGDDFATQSGTGVSVSAGPFVTPTEVAIGVSGGGGFISLGNVTADGTLVDGNGGVVAVVSGVDQGPAITANGTAYTGDGYLDGINVTAYNGGPQTITLSEGTTAGGPVVAVFVVSAAGVYPFSAKSRPKFPTGLYATFSGGTSRTMRALVEPA
jgi:hypothetical protein